MNYTPVSIGGSRRVVGQLQHPSNRESSQRTTSDQASILMPNGGYAFFATIPVDGITQGFSVSSLVYDHFEDLLWAGNNAGHVTSYYGQYLQKYTSFQAFPVLNEVRCLSTFDCGVIALSRNGLKCHSRQGLVVFNYASPSFVDMQSMANISAAQLVLGGFQKKLVMLDLNRLQEIKTCEMAENNCVILRFNDRFLYAGDASGKVSLKDPRSLETVQVFQAHTGALSDFDVCGTKMVTCGFSNRLGQLTSDRFLMIYDLRTLKSLPPVPTSFDPAFLRFVRTFSDNRLIIASQSGQFQVLQIGSLARPTLVQQVQSEMLYTMDISSSQQCLAFGDTVGCIHLFGDRENPIVNEGSRPTEFADTAQTLPFMSFADEYSPLAAVPLPVCDDGRVSDFPPNLCRRVYRQPLPIDPSILRSVKVVQFIGYARKPPNLLRNQVPYDLTADRSLKKAAQRDSDHGVPKPFRRVVIHHQKAFDEINYEHYNQTEFTPLENHVPNAYCNALLILFYHLKPVRQGIKLHVCKKEFCLACELSFLFDMLDQKSGRQPIAPKNFVRAYRTQSDALNLSLLLNDKQDGVAQKANFALLIQGFCRFILRQLHCELSDTSPTWRLPSLDVTLSSADESSTGDLDSLLATPNSQRHCDVDGDAAFFPTTTKHELPLSNVDSTIDSGCAESIASSHSKSEPQLLMEELFAGGFEHVTVCKCSSASIRRDKSLLVSLAYPLGQDLSTAFVPFAKALEKSMFWEQSTQAWCEKCERYQQMVQRRRVLTLPDVLLINCQVETAREREFWAAQQKHCSSLNCAAPATCSGDSVEVRKPWVPFSMSAFLNDGKVSISEAHQENEALSPSVVKDTKNYSLFAVISLIQQSAEAHLVSCLKVGKSRSRETSALLQEKCKLSDFCRTSESPVAMDRVSESSGGSAPLEGLGQGQANSEWVLFNSFRVSYISEADVTYFDLDWNTPCVLCYTAANLNERYAHLEGAKSPITEAVFLLADSLGLQRRLSHSSTFTPLDCDDLPKPGDLVAIDAEFVELNQEEAELKSDGTSSTIKPSELSVARVSCVRGCDPNTPFLDDYISTQEQVVNYLTKYSGIQPGDLNPTITSKHLTTLKSTYLKLRYLADTGIRFVGHGLLNDFKVLNIVVPPHQIIDTVQLFRLRKQRMISLRFLAFYFLGIRIQAETHDSVEDAKTALKLYQKYLQLKQLGASEFERILVKLYEKGRQWSWNVPEA